MSVKLYVGNLPHAMTEAELNTLFSEAGNVASAKIITDRQTGQPRGFGFVEMETKVEGPEGHFHAQRPHRGRAALDGQ